jgi:hypothetical protein
MNIGPGGQQKPVGLPFYFQAEALGREAKDEPTRRPEISSRRKVSLTGNQASSSAFCPAEGSTHRVKGVAAGK